MQLKLVFDILMYWFWRKIFKTVSCPMDMVSTQLARKRKQQQLCLG